MPGATNWLDFFQKMNDASFNYLKRGFLLVSLAKNQSKDILDIRKVFEK